MSFILDALKKSETERQQSGTTEFAAVPTNPVRQQVPRWLLLLGFLLAINLVVLLGLLLRSDSQPAGEQPAAAVTAPAPSQQQPQPQTGSFQDQVAAARRSPPRNAPQETAVAAEVEKPLLQADLISQHPESVAAADLYPTIQEVRVSNTVALPDLHLDIHVYSEEPADRFAFINMAKIREGSQLAEGPVVVEIRPDGVVLRHLGTTFLVPRE